jgi:hypothetical protein
MPNVYWSTSTVEKQTDLAQMFCIEIFKPAVLLFSLCIWLFFLMKQSHGRNSLLWNWWSLSRSRNSSSFIEPVNSLSCSTETSLFQMNPVKVMTFYLYVVQFNVIRSFTPVLWLVCSYHIFQSNCVVLFIYTSPCVIQSLLVSFAVISLSQKYCWGT